MQLVAIQMTSSDNIDDNLNQLEAELAALSLHSVNGHLIPTLILLPENFALLANTKAYKLCAEYLDNGVVQRRLSELAMQYQCWIVAGSFPIKAPEGSTDDRVFTTSLVFDPLGELIAHYNKIHLFDVTVLNSETHKAVEFSESASFIPGDRIVTFTANDVKFGMAICYDLRFPALFQALSEECVDVLLLPAAFTYTTGKAHWQALLTARAIETQCYVLAANQVGEHPNGASTWGHSMIIDPWGECLTKIETKIGAISCMIDISKLQQIRTNMPISQHARFTTSLKNKE